MSRYILVDRGSGSRAGQLLRHHEDPTRWLARVYLGRDGKGKRRTRSQVIHGTKRTAQATLTEMLQHKNQGTLKARSTATLRDTVTAWLDTKINVEARTLDGYKASLDTYVLPVIGHKRLTDVTRQDIQSLYSDMSAGTLPEECKEAGWRGDPLGPRTVRLTHAALSQVLKYAVQEHWLAINPAAGVTLPRLARASRKMNALSIQERLTFITASQGSFYEMLYRLLMDTGLRPGEAMALTWADVDFERGTIEVTKAVTRDAAGQAVIGAPKNDASIRTVPLFGLADLLAEHQAWQQEVSLDGSGRVFTTQDGRPLRPWAFSRRELARVVTAAGIEGAFSLYNFRHTFATLQLESGTPLTVVSKWLGHSTIQQTADTYQHVADTTSLDWAARHVAHLEAHARSQEARVTN